MQRKPTCLVLTGPTASGKTEVGLFLAERLHAEILCMDSMQIYRGMDIGTAKPTAAELARAPHHLLDLVEPIEAFSVADYVQAAEACARSVFDRGKLPLFLGGTCLYLHALREQMSLGQVGSDPEFRADLEAIAASEAGKALLHDQLQQVDRKTAERLHPNDIRRVIRALEVYHLTGVPFSEQPKSIGSAPFDYRVVALDWDREELYRRINLRVDRMIERGLIEEVQYLLDQGVPADAQAMKAIGYKEIVPYLRGETDRASAISLLKQNTRHYAKRQWTWLRHEQNITWVDGSKPDAAETILNLWKEEMNER